jgi:uncharacterized protein (TIGR02246 family)
MTRPISTLLLAHALACAHAPADTQRRDRAAVVQVLREQQDAWNRGDLDGFLRGYDPTPALVFTSGGRVRRGFVETRARYVQRYGASGPAGMGRLDFEVLDVRILGPGAAIVLGRWRLRGTPEAGAGVFTLAFQRTAQGWRIVHDHTSADAP